MMLADHVDGKEILSRTRLTEDVTVSTRKNISGVGKHRSEETVELPSMEPNAKRIHLSPSIRITCRARGLSRDHNADTAYFQIPSDAPHGMLVSCSHPECRKSGRQFRYCKVCEVPVAKRNFLQRHGHGIVNTTLQLRMEVDEAYGIIGNSSGIATCHPCQSDTVSCDQSPTTSIPIEEGSIRRHSHLNIFEKAWLKVLHERAQIDDAQHLEQWLDKVMAFYEHYKAPSSESMYEPTPFTPLINALDSHLVPPLLSSTLDASKSMNEMEHQPFGLDAEPSSSILINIEHTHLTNSEVAEFHEFMGSVDINCLFN